MKTTKTFKILAQMALTSSLAVAVGCTFIPQVGQPGGFSQQGLSGQNVDYTEAFEKFQAQRKAEAREKLRNKVPHTGPIEVSLNPGLLARQNGSQHSGKAIQISERLSEQNFRIQSEAAMIFEETFSKGTGPLELTREFQVPDTSKVYTLLVTSGDEQGQHSVTSAFVNINGHDWVRPNDFSGAVDIRKPSGQRLSQGPQTREFQKSGLLLQTHNSLRLTLNGAPGSTLTLKIVEGGAAGAIRRVNGPMNEHPTQHHHVISNDTNLFDPSQPDSLGDLEALDGDLAEDTPDGEFRLAGVQVNDSRTIQFESGVLILKFREAHGLAAFQQLYDAEVLEQLDGYYRIRLNLDKSPVLQTLPLLKAYNEGSPEDITSASFSSLNALKTFVVVLDAVQQIPDLLEAIEFNQVAEMPTYEPVDWAVGHSLFSDRPDIQSWWLSQTNTVDAWEYSIGTGVKVAFLDMGYNPAHPEIKRRLILNKNNNHTLLGAWNRNDISMPNAQTDLNNPNALCSPWHGHCSLMTGFAERDNFHASGNARLSVGVAPNTHVIPYAAHTSHDYSTALREAIEHGPDVIGFNHGFRTFSFSSFLSSIRNIATLTSTTHLLEAAIAVNNAGIPLIVAAHNNDEHIREYQPQLLGTDSSFPIIVVGAVMPIQPPVSGTAQAQFPYKPYTTFNHAIPKGGEKRGSNYGPNLIWAPGEEIYVADPDSNSLNLIVHRATSAATPFVTGVVALMKSRHPQMSPQQIKSTLLTAQNTSGTSISVASASEMFKAGFTNAKMLNVQNALERTISHKHGSVRTQDRAGIAQNYYGWFRHENYFDQSLVFNQNHFSSAPSPEKQVNILNTLSDDMIARGKDKLVGFYGWRGNNISAGKALIPPFPVNAMFKTLSDTDIEALGFVDILEPNDRNNCPQILHVSPNQISGPASITVTGELLFSPEQLPELILQPQSGGALVSMPLNPGHAETHLAQDGSLARFVIESHHFNSLKSGENYRMAFKGFYCNGEASRGGALNFNPSLFLKVGSDLQLATVTDDVLNSGQLNGIPIQAFLGEGQTVDANIGANALVAVTGDKSNLSVEIGGVQVPIMAVVEDMIAFGIPPQVPTGIQDVIISAAGGSVTLAQAIRILSPIPQPSPTPTPGIQGAPIIVSFPGGASNVRPPVNPGLFSTLVGFMDSFGNSASWVGINNISQPVQVSYPPAPGLPTASDGTIPLKINIQVAKNESQGGTVTVQQGSTSIGVLPAQEGTVHSLTFFGGAHASNGSSIYIQLHGTDPDAQLIYSMQAQAAL